MLWDVGLCENLVFFFILEEIVLCTVVSLSGLEVELETMHHN